MNLYKKFIIKKKDINTYFITYYLNSNKYYIIYNCSKISIINKLLI